MIGQMMMRTQFTKHKKKVERNRSDYYLYQITGRITEMK